MNPQTQCCHNPYCRARGPRGGRGTFGCIANASRAIDASRVGHTFAATKGTPFYRVRTFAEFVTVVLTLLLFLSIEKGAIFTPFAKC